jgi:Secretion system C-terminal sorting domain
MNPDVTNDQKISNCAPLGLEENLIDESLASLFPNPASKEMTIRLSLEKPKSTQLHIFDVLENVDIAKNIYATESEIRLDISNWASGIYYLEIDDGHSKVD